LGDNGGHALSDLEHNARGLVLSDA